MPLPLPPPGVPGHWDGRRAIEWLAQHPGAGGTDPRWFFAAIGTLDALRATGMAAAVAERLRHSPAKYVTGIVAWAAADTSDLAAIPGDVRAWLTAHQEDIAAFLDGVGRPGAHPPRPYGPVVVDHARVLLCEALTVPAANNLHSETVAMVRTVEMHVNATRLAPSAPGRSQPPYGDVMYLGGATWEADGPLTGSGVDLEPGPDLGYHRLALYLLGPGAAEATVTQIEPGPAGAADLVVSHAMSVLAAGGVERVVGRIPYQSAWRRQTQWQWDPDERAYNVAQLRAAVIEGGAQWLSSGGDREALMSIVADLHGAAGVDRPVLAVHGRDLCENTGEFDAGERLWGPLLDYDADVLGYFGPASGGGGQRLGEWIFNAGRLNVGGVHQFTAAGTGLDQDIVAAAGPERGRRSRRPDGPDTSVGL
jgi:hypothetical protein